MKPAIKIICPDGDWRNAKIINGEDGSQIRGVTSVKFNLEFEKITSAELTFCSVAIEGRAMDHNLSREDLEVLRKLRFANEIEEDEKRG